MRKFIISKKAEGTGSILDLASEHFDRVIRVKSNYNYFIVFAAYYGRGSLFFTSEDRLSKEYKRLNDLGYSFRVFNANGQALTFDGVGFSEAWEYPRLELESN